MIGSGVTAYGLCLLLLAVGLYGALSQLNRLIRLPLPASEGSRTDDYTAMNCGFAITYQTQDVIVKLNRLVEGTLVPTHIGQTPEQSTLGPAVGNRRNELDAFLEGGNRLIVVAVEMIKISKVIERQGLGAGTAKRAT